MLCWRSVGVLVGWVDGRWGLGNGWEERGLGVGRGKVKRGGQGEAVRGGKGEAGGQRAGRGDEEREKRK